MVEVGALYPLTKDEEVDESIPALLIREGLNHFGRNDSVLFTKQISRQHVSITVAPSGETEITVDGPNPVVLRSGPGKRKLSPKSKCALKHGDVIEFIPQTLPFKYISNASCVALRTPNLPVVVMLISSDENKTERLSTAELLNDPREGRQSQIDEDEELARLLQEEDDLSRKRKVQEDEDEAFARLLQEEEHRATTSSFRTTATGSEGHESKKSRTQVTEPGNAASYQLMHTQAIPNWANRGCIRIQDVMHGDIQLAILSNYMVDIQWLLSACPSLTTVPQVVIVHGEGGQSLDLLQASKPKNWILFKPPLRLSYGTHHSKAMLLVYPTGIRVVVHTANLIHVDWNNKTQGLWMQDFPYKGLHAGQMAKKEFEDDLVEYLTALEWPGSTMTLPKLGQVRINANFFRRFDYSSATVRLVASVPGYHKGRDLTRWGHMKLRTVLQSELFEDQFQKAPLVFQFSSLGSLDEKWIGELTASMCAGSTLGKKPLGTGRAQIVWPTVEDVRGSLEGYAAGNAVPSPEKNVKKEFLKRFWAKWKADHTGRSRAIPHLKSYLRYNGQALAWFLLTSSNLSKAAWGALQKNGTQIMIRSFELGVCFLPSTVLRQRTRPFSCTDGAASSAKSLGHRLTPSIGENGSDDGEVVRGRLVTSCSISGGESSPDGVVGLPVPYLLPPPPYESEDVPWSWDRVYRKPDVYGEVWPRFVQLYS